MTSNLLKSVVIIFHRPNVCHDLLPPIVVMPVLVELGVFEARPKFLATSLVCCSYF